jgi:excisionase family DNA binding protein
MPRLEATGQKAPSAERVVYTVPEAGRLLGLSRNGSYEAAKRGEIPTIRIGRRLLVPKAPFHRMLEVAGTGTATPAENSAWTTIRHWAAKRAGTEDEGVETRVPKGRKEPQT